MLISNEVVDVQKLANKLMLNGALVTELVKTRKSLVI